MSDPTPILVNGHPLPQYVKYVSGRLLPCRGGTCTTLVLWARTRNDKDMPLELREDGWKAHHAFCVDVDKFKRKGKS